MKTVKQYLKELDSEKLVDQYIKDYPIDYELYLDRDLTIAELKQKYRDSILHFISYLCELTTKEQKDEETCILFAHKFITDDNLSHYIDYDLVFKNDLLTNGVDAEIYCYTMTEQAEIIGFYVSDDKYTLDHIYGLIANVLYEASFYGYDEESQKMAIEESIMAMEESKNGKTTPLEEVLEELQLGKDAVFDKETPIEKKLRIAAIDAINEYNEYCVKETLASIKNMIKSDSQYF